MQLTRQRCTALLSDRVKTAVFRLAVSAIHLTALLIFPMYAIAQTPRNVFEQIINDDLQAQAQAAISEGHRKRALVLLNELAQRDPRQAGALLDIAILYCELGERAQSLRTLAHLEAQYEVPPAIGKLILYYRANTCTSVELRPQLAVSVGAGVTSNANFGPSDPIVTFAPGAPLNSLTLAPESLPHRDQYIESAIQGEYPIPAVPGLELIGGLSDRHYRSLHNFDQRAVTIGITDRTSFMHGEVDNQFTTNVLWLGTHIYQRDLAWHGGFWLPAAAWQPLLMRGGLDLTVVDSAYPGNSLYDAMYFAVRAAFQVHVGKRTSMQFFFGPAWDWPHDGRPGGMQRGYSAWLSLDYDMDRHGQLEAILQQRTLNDATAYDPVFFGSLNQRQTIRVAALRYTCPVTAGWSLYAQMSAQRVSSSISLFAYTVYSGSLGLSWKY
ncbi:MAG: tetratricopeptide repeat protein [Terracidiphilus sp.]|nr:tetratricopeptide repeat protein [Terracidiphilus sp.]